MKDLDLEAMRRLAAPYIDVDPSGYGVNQTVIMLSRYVYELIKIIETAEWS